MSDKKSFVLYKDTLDVLDDMTNEQVGILFKAIKNYQCGKDYKITDDLKLLFSTFKSQFIRDDEKYKHKSETNKNNGSKGGKQRVANAKSRKRLQAFQADSDSDSDSDSDIFNSFRELFGGKKNGNGTEFKNFKKQHKDWKDVLPLLQPAVKKEIEWRKQKREFTPQWKNLSTWINNRCWEQEFEPTPPPKKELEPIPASYIFNNVKIDYGNYPHNED
jgi:hypothetical protein